MTVQFHMDLQTQTPTTQVPNSTPNKHGRTKGGIVAGKGVAGKKYVQSELYGVLQRGSSVTFCHFHPPVILFPPKDKYISHAFWKLLVIFGYIKVPRLR